MFKVCAITGLKKADLPNTEMWYSTDHFFFPKMSYNFCYSKVTLRFGGFFFFFFNLGCGFKLLVSTEAEKTTNEGKLLWILCRPELLIGSKEFEVLLSNLAKINYRPTLNPVDMLA